MNIKILSYIIFGFSEPVVQAAGARAAVRGRAVVHDGGVARRAGARGGRGGAASARRARPRRQRVDHAARTGRTVAAGPYINRVFIIFCSRA